MQVLVFSTAATSSAANVIMNKDIEQRINTEVKHQMNRGS